MITVHLQGGLGNQLFQLAFLDWISKKTGKDVYINSLESPTTVHSKEQYFNTIFKKWRNLYKTVNSVSIYEHPKFLKQEWNTPSLNTKYIGYFQKYEYMDPIRDDFIAKLCFDESILDKYPGISKKTAIHIRGGDYVGNTFHEQPLRNYYNKCMQLCGCEFVVFTNDIKYARSIIPNCEIINENEVNSIYLMSKAKGVICANSSFSWWGAYLNPNRPIFMPSKWFNDMSIDTSGFYFKGVRIIDINV
jgi:hypothetical protein